MSLECIAEHTVDLNLLTGGWVLDAGCRNFSFARGLVERGCKVIAIDADPTVEDPQIEGVTFINCAIAAESGMRTMVMSDDPQARFLVPQGHTMHTSVEQIKVDAFTIEYLMELGHVGHWDVVKLDVEGSEYGILRSWPGPIATQISIEFHEHCKPREPKVYDDIFKYLTQWYDVVQHKKEARHCCPPNYWDSLLILRGA